MRFDRPSYPSVETLPDLDDEAVVLCILEIGTDEEMQQLKLHIEKRDHTTISPERTELARQFARQRRRLTDKSDAETEERIATNPKATELEYAIGAYREHLEAPVRDVVFTLRQKGYASYESGFSGLEGQKISFTPPIAELGAHRFSDTTKAAFDAVGAKPYASENAIGFTMSTLIPDERLTSLWNVLISELPTLQRVQPMTSLPSAVGFRQKQDARFKKDEV